jgi:hypothetical protein
VSRQRESNRGGIKRERERDRGKAKDISMYIATDVVLVVYVCACVYPSLHVCIKLIPHDQSLDSSYFKSIQRIFDHEAILASVSCNFIEPFLNQSLFLDL